MTEKKLNIEDLKKQLEECQKLKDEYLAGWQRARADFLNYKKEEIERISEILKYVGEELILKILPVLDSFEEAKTKVPASLKSNDEYIKGFFQIKTQFQNFLKSQGVEEIKCLGQRFNPNFQEAVEEIEAENKEPGIILEEVQKGYTLHNKVLRPTKVKISK